MLNGATWKAGLMTCPRLLLMWFGAGEADISSIPMEEGDQFIVLASDGLWDVMSSDEAVSFVHNVMSAHVGALREGGNGTMEGGSERPGDVVAHVP